MGVLSISGGSGIVYADAAVRGGMTLPPFSERDAGRAAQGRAGVRLAGEPRRRDGRRSSTTCACSPTALEVVLADPGIDQLSILLASVSGPSAARACEAIAAAAARTGQADARGLVGPAGEVGRRR